MIIYGALLIPFIIAFLLYKYFKRDVTWWEYLIPLGVSILLTFSSKAIIEVVQVSCKEYWGSFIQRVEYYEDWDEWVTRTCTRSCCCDSKGENCGTETYDCSYRQYHPPYWQIVTTTDETIYISEEDYNQIKKLFGNEAFKDLGRSYYTDDGDEYFSNWPGDSLRSQPVTTVHSYENRIKAADQSVFHFMPVSKADRIRYDIKDYPDKDSYIMPAVIGDSALNASEIDQQFQYLNALLGHKKEIRVFVLLFQNQPIDAALYQEWYWSGGNMNEFVICIGIDKARAVKWCKVLSWTRSEILKAEVRRFVEEQPKLDLKSLAYYLQQAADKEFIRRDFKEFSYLTVEPPLWAVILTYFLTLIANLAVSYWIIKNEY